MTRGSVESVGENVCLKNEVAGLSAYPGTPVPSTIYTAFIAVAPVNILSILVVVGNLGIVHPLMGWLNALAPENM